MATVRSLRAPPLMGARASRVSLAKARSLHLAATRWTQPVLLSQRHARYESSQAIYNVVNPDHSINPDPGAPAEPADQDQTALAGRTDLPPFSSLKDKVRYETIKALTIKPFQLKTMSPVQAEVLPLLPELAEVYDPARQDETSARDLLVKAKTGTGKTLAFLVPAVEQRLNAIRHHVQKTVRDSGLASDRLMEQRAERQYTRLSVGTLIISPTRELATQIANEALRLTHHHDGFEVRLFVGGVSKRVQMRDWMKGRRDIVVATPGRLRDLLESEPPIRAGIEKAQMLVLDEADTLLDMGFREDIDAITKHLPPTPHRQTFLFSATVSKQIQQVARATLDKRHTFINTVTEDDSPVHAHVPQYHTVLPSAQEQLPHILRLLAHDQLTNPTRSKAIVFLPTTKMTQLFATLLRELSATTLPAGRNTKVYEIHSKRTQEARTNTSDMFRNDKSGASILVTSDVSARGIDYPGVSRVIQVGIPAGTEQYIHRVGRTGRAGAKDLVKSRGDLVLLPWEIGFVTWQLNEVSLRPLTVNELKTQVKELAEQFEADPTPFLKDAPKPTLRGPRSVPPDRFFHKQPTGIIANLDSEVKGLLERVDEQAIKETFASLLGYYLAKSPELRTQRGVILEGCKAWTTGAMGLPSPPYVSAQFLERLGVNDGRTKHFSRPRDRDMQMQSRGGRSPWDQRGRTGKPRDSFGWRDDGEVTGERDDDLGDPAEYRSQRYDRPHYDAEGRSPPRRRRQEDRGQSGGYGSSGQRPSRGGSDDAGGFGYGSRDRDFGGREGRSSDGYGFQRNRSSGGFGISR